MSWGRRPSPKQRKQQRARMLEKIAKRKKLLRSLDEGKIRSLENKVLRQNRALQSPLSRLDGSPPRPVNRVAAEGIRHRHRRKK
jgi:hypothetical protein